MSAFMSVRFPNSIQLLADGAVYDDNGEVLSFVDKISVSRTVPVAITARGRTDLALPLAMLLCELADSEGIDDLLKALHNVETNLNMRRHFTEPDNGQFDLAIALWHPVTGPAHYRVHNCASMPDFTPFVLHELGDFIACGTAFNPDQLFRAGILPVTSDPTEWARTNGGDIMDMMRQSKGEPLPGALEEPQYIIGGHVDLATITASGVTLQRIRRYKDKIGKKIDPTKDRKALSPHDGLSRQQRRALERQAKRSVA